MGQSHEPPERLRLDPARIAEFIERLERERQVAPACEHRKHSRFAYRVRDLLVEAEEQPTHWRKYGCPTRDISATGVSFLFGHFVYPGSRVRVQLTSLQNARSTHAGRIVRCRYITGSARLHDVGVMFDDAIDVSLFHRGAIPTRILLADDDPMIHRLVPKFLRELHVTLTSVSNGREAVERATSQRFDLVILDVRMPEVDGMAAARQLREKGCTTPLIAVTMQSEAESRSACLEAGFDHWVAKPLSGQEFASLVMTYQVDPIVSSLLHDTGMAEIIDDFVDGLRARLHDMYVLLAKNSLTTLGDRLRVLRADAVTAGFDAISVVVSDAAKLLESSAAMPLLKSKLAQIAKLCNAARGVSCKEVV